METFDVVEFVDSTADIAPAGRIRLRKSGGQLQVSISGAAYVSAGALIDPASASSAGSMSAADFSKLLAMYRPKQGTALTDADQTLQPFTDKASEYVQATTLTANRTKTLGTTTVVTGTLVRIVRTDTAAKTLAVVNGGTAAGTLFTFDASPTEIQAATFYYNGVDWLRVGFEYLLVT